MCKSRQSAHNNNTQHATPKSTGQAKGQRGRGTVGHRDLASTVWDWLGLPGTVPGHMVPNARSMKLSLPSKVNSVKPNEAAAQG